MIDSNSIYEKIIGLLDGSNARYELFSHREALTWEELEEVQKETGFFGKEMKCLVMKAGDDIIVYVTLQGNKINFEALKQKLKVKKVRLLTPEELNEYFGAKPGCAYPFGFDARYDIYVDPQVHKEDWLLFSPVLPTKTVQVKGEDLKKVFSMLENKITEVTDFNI